MKEPETREEWAEQVSGGWERTGSAYVERLQVLQGLELGSFPKIYRDCAICGSNLQLLSVDWETCRCEVRCSSCFCAYIMTVDEVAESIGGES